MRGRHAILWKMAVTMSMRLRERREKVLLGKWNEQDLEGMLHAAAQISAVSKRIAFLSAQFLDVPYQEFTLIGSVNTLEIFTINLEAVDCFTYLDYVEAMRLSDSFASFKEMLRIVRYREGEVSYKKRNHFFTDWIRGNSRLRDVTDYVGGDNVRFVRKRLNDQGNGIYLLDGITPEERDIIYIPGATIDAEVIHRLRTGDYIGIYSETKGLDVSHVGILIKKKGTAFFRHASSAESRRRVVDQDFNTYAASKPGIIVLRPVA
jgi:Protein of unknown function (DUF1460)